jgi:hypothetical protein
MKIALSLLVLIFLSVSAYAQTPVVNSVNVTDYGIYTATRHEDQPSGQGIGHAIETDERLAAMTRTVPMQLGVHFGFHFTMVGAPAGAMVPLRMVTYFPSPGLRNPQASQPILRHEYTRNTAIGQPQYHDYSFDSPWELVPGTWTMEIWYGDRKLVSQSFTVAK